VTSPCEVRPCPDHPGLVPVAGRTGRPLAPAVVTRRVVGRVAVAVVVAVVVAAARAPSCGGQGTCTQQHGRGRGIGGVGGWGCPRPLPPRPGTSGPVRSPLLREPAAGANGGRGWCSRRRWRGRREGGASPRPGARWQARGWEWGLVAGAGGCPKCWCRLAPPVTLLPPAQRCRQCGQPGWVPQRLPHHRGQWVRVRVRV
jgi:hypothetical protein